jgi:hypothetical protein
MPRKLKQFGPCCICGVEGKLSFEHVPPRSAFNDHPILMANVKEMIGKWDGEIGSIKRKVHQLGAGGYTLCERCNNNTGAWYSKAFADWAYQGFRVLQDAKGSPALYYQFRIFPLRVIKQIVCMFFSANGPNFRTAHPDLVKFVLNREESFMNPDTRIYVYYNMSPVSRQSGVTGLLKVDKGQRHTFSEIAYVPFGYIMTLESRVPDDRPIDISIFANYRYNDWKEFSLQLPVLPVYTYFPGDYRNRDEVLETAAEEKRKAREKANKVVNPTG